MKKTFAVAVLMILFGFLAVNAQAQDFSWNNPALLGAPKIVEMLTKPSTPGVFGRDAGGNERLLDLTNTVSGALSDLGDTSNMVDMAIGDSGEIFECTQTRIKKLNVTSKAFEDLVPQPLLPIDGGILPRVAAGGIIPGGYSHIALGDDGKLYVLYETGTGAQYVLVGNPPEDDEDDEDNAEATVLFAPRMLNLKSHGKWVNCIVTLPPDMDANNINPDSVKIVEISISNTMGDIKTEVVDIPRDPASKTHVVTLLDEKEVFMAKFIRYDKANPANPLSLNGKLTEMLTGQLDGFYQVQLKVSGMLTTNEPFSGSDVIRVKLKTSKKPKSK